MNVISVSVDGCREFVPCGKCNFCREARRADWSFRLRQECLVSSSTYFLTLTYEDKKIPVTQDGEQTLRKKDLQDFLKRLRKEAPTKLRYYACGEYGSNTDRPHYHAVLFNLPAELTESITRIWGHGHTVTYEVNDARIHYVTKFHVNPIGKGEGRAPPFAIMSRRPGLGINYLDTHKQWHLDALRAFTKVNGFLARLPRFYVDKIFTKEQKQLIAAMAPSERQVYFEELARLSKLHPEPADYYNERKRYAHDQVRDKSNQYDQF